MLKWPELTPPFGDALLYVGAYNTSIALFLTALGRYTLSTNLLYSQCVGFGIYFSTLGTVLLRGRTRPEWVDTLTGIPVGAVLGLIVAIWLDGETISSFLQEHMEALLITGVFAIFFGVLGFWRFHDQARLREARDEAQAERLRRIEQESSATRMQLSRLQAQIEPHFLFNTLSNVVGLMDTNAAAARRMLLNFTALLRTSLTRTRRPTVTLGEECDLLRAYLEIAAIRMGARLVWRIDAEPATLAASLPPLLVQPLVENALRHGIEPKPEGGTLTIRSYLADSALIVEVANTGCTFPLNAPEGVGLANVRERLHACYGQRASLELEAGEGGGLTARIRLPYELHEPTPGHR